MLVEYTAAGAIDNPPTPVTPTVHGVNADPVNKTEPGHDTTVTEVALEIVNNTCDADEPEWLASPAKDASAVAVPAFVLPEYDTVVEVDNPPTPVTLAVHGVRAAPVNTTDTVHDNVTTEAARVIVNDLAAEAPTWLASPANTTCAVAVPALVLPEYDTTTGANNPPTPDTLAVHGVRADPVNANEAGQYT
jgi:hypothetical protein